MLTRRLHTLVCFVSSETPEGLNCLASVSLTLHRSEERRVHERTFTSQTLKENATATKDLILEEIDVPPENRANIVNSQIPYGVRAESGMT